MKLYKISFWIILFVISFAVLQAIAAVPIQMVEISLKTPYTLDECQKGKSPNIEFHSQRKESKSLFVITARDDYGWSYVNQIGYNIISSDLSKATYVKNASGKKEFSPVCPKKWEKYQYFLYACNYSREIAPISETLSLEDVVAELQKYCEDAMWTSFFLKNE